MRIVTTLLSATETVAALGLEPVATSHECDYPPGVEDLPSVTDSRIDANASSGEIDQQVLEIAENDADVYDIDSGPPQGARARPDRHARDVRFCSATRVADDFNCC